MRFVDNYFTHTYMVRKTQQRETLQAVLHKAGRPLNVPEIHELALAMMPKLGIATVYREVKRLAEEEAIARVDIPGENAPRYEMRHDHGHHHHHHHFKCESCERVFDIEGCALPAAALKLPKGFTQRDHEITIYGTCSRCS